MKHTPGPWIARLEGENWLIEANNRKACIAYGASWYSDLQPGEANARLIAAAPEMLEALKEAEEQSRKRLPVKKETWLKMQAVIAKAEGR